MASAGVSTWAAARAQEARGRTPMARCPYSESMVLRAYSAVVPPALQQAFTAGTASRTRLRAAQVSASQLPGSASCNSTRTTGQTYPATHGRKTLRRALWVVAALTAAQVPPVQASKYGLVRLQDDAAEAFAEYVHASDAQFDRRLVGDLPFLWSQQDPARAEALSLGDVIVDPTPIPGRLAPVQTLIHDWTAALLVPHSNAEHLVSIVSAYDNHAETYGPEVVRSRVLESDGLRIRVSMRLLKKNVVTAVLETEHSAQFEQLDSQRWWGRSESTSIREVVRPGKPDESLRPPGHDRGFLWKLVVYWRFADTPEGAVLEHRTISLTRSPPKWLRWATRPLIEGLPRKSLASILRTTSAAAREP